MKEVYGLGHELHPMTGSHGGLYVRVAGFPRLASGYCWVTCEGQSLGEVLQSEHA